MDDLERLTILASDAYPELADAWLRRLRDAKATMDPDKFPGTCVARDPFQLRQLASHFVTTEREPETRWSSLAAALRDARGATHRSLTTGLYEGDDVDHAAYWLGALGYLAVLDQLGTCFALVGSTDRPTSFLIALADFTPLDEQVAEALYALRCSIAHDYSLFNLSTRSSRQHRFTLTTDDRTPLVVLPRAPWNGSYDDLQDDSSTVVNLRRVGDLVEATIESCWQLICANEVQWSTVQGHLLSWEEFAIRYSFTVKFHD